MFCSPAGTADPVPSLDELDRQLAHWATQVARVKANRQFLEQQATYEFIKTGWTLSGISRLQVMDPILAASQLADQEQQLEGIVAKAQQLRTSIRPLIPSDKTIREINRLLNKPCIPLPAAQIPLAQRNLLDDPVAQSEMSLRQLVDAMTSAFAAARDGVVKYDAAMAHLKPALGTAEAELDALAARAQQLGTDAGAALGRVRDAVQATRRLVLDDPLAATADFESQIRQHLTALKNKLDDFEQLRMQAQAELNRAQQRQHSAERGRVDAAQLEGLREWLTSIEATVAAGRYAAALVGLARWDKAATPVYAAEDQRQGQLGLLRALRVKVQSLRTRGLDVRPELDSLALRADALLRQEQPDVAAAAQLLLELQRGLAALR